SQSVGTVTAGEVIGVKIGQVGTLVGYSAEQVTLVLSEISRDFQPKAFEGRSPYKGLEAFDEADADLFFGREKLVQDLVARIAAARCLFVAGPSGSGKSSLVRAGLVPALKQAALSGSERWLYE